MGRSFVMGARLNLNSRGFTSGARTAAATTASLDRSITSTDRSVRSLRGSNQRLTTTVDNYSDQARTAATATDRFDKQAQGLGNTMRGVKGLVAAFMGSMAVKAAGSWLVGSNADMETYRNTLTVVMGSQEKAIEQLKWAESFASKTPFEISSIVEATTKLESYGLASQKVLGITGDMASVMGKDLMQAVEAVADAQTGEVERLKEFGITKDMIAEQAKLMGVTAVNAKGQISDMAAFNTALFTLMEKKFQGGMEMQAGTWKGMISNVKDFISKVGRMMGAPLFDKLKGQLERVVAWIGSLDDATIQGWVDKVIAGATQVAQVIGRTAAFLWKHRDLIVSAISGMAAGFAAFKIITTVTKWVKTLRLAIMLLNAGIITISWPIVAAVAAIGLLVGAFVLAWKKSETFRNVVTGAIEKVKAVVTPAITAIKTAILGAFTAITTWVQQYSSKFMAIVSFFWAWIGPYISVYLELLKTVIGNAFGIIRNIIDTVWTVITTIISTAWNTISNIVGFWLNILTGDFSGAFENIKNIFQGLWDGITGILGNFIGNIFDSGKKIMETLAAGIKAAVKAPIEAVKGGFKKIRKLLPFSDAKEGPFSQLTHNGSKIMTTLGEGVDQGKGEFYDKVSGAFSDINVNAAGSAAVTGGRGGNTIKIEKLIEKIELQDVGDKDTGTLINEIIAQLYEKLKSAEDLFDGGEGKAVLL